MLPHNPQKEVRSILSKIETGHANEASIASLVELIDKQPYMVPEVTGVLTSTLLSGNTKACSSAISALNIVADRDIRLVADYVYVIMGCIQRRKKDLGEDGTLKAIEILLKITQKHPERMDTAVSELLICLESTSIAIREKTYFLLALLVIMHHNAFRGHSKQIIRALNGLNVDERIYACRLIKKISEKDPRIVEDTCDDLEYLRLNHPDNKLRSEAAYAMEALKEALEKKPYDLNAKVVEPEKDKSLSELIELVTPDEKDFQNILEGMGLKHMIVNKGILKNGTEVNTEDSSTLETLLRNMVSSKVIEAVVIVNSEDKILAKSGTHIDSSLLSKLVAMISLESNAEFRSRVSIEHADKKIVAVRVGNRDTMAMMTGADTPISTLLLELDKSVEQIDKLLSEV